ATSAAPCWVSRAGARCSEASPATRASRSTGSHGAHLWGPAVVLADGLLRDPPDPPPIPPHRTARAYGREHARRRSHATQGHPVVDQEARHVRGAARRGRVEGEGRPDLERRGRGGQGHRGAPRRERGELRDRTVDELRDRAKELGLSGYSDKTKDELV